MIANKEECFVDMTGYPVAEPLSLKPLRIATARALLRVAEDQLDALSDRLAFDSLDGRTAAQAQRDLDEAAVKIVHRNHQLSHASA